MVRAPKYVMEYYEQEWQRIVRLAKSGAPITFDDAKRAEFLINDVFVGVVVVPTKAGDAASVNYRGGNAPATADLQGAIERTAK